MTAARPVFVVGAPRTGTTLVKEVLNGHPRVWIFDEVHFFERVWDDRERIGDLRSPESRRRAFEILRAAVCRVGQDRAVADLLPDAEFERRLEAEGGDYRGLLAALLKTGAETHGADFWGDSSPQDVLYVARIREWFPDARLVGLVRDPRGFLASYKNYWRRRVPTYRERYNPLTNSLLWKSYMSALLEAKRGPHAEAVMLLRYEDLVDDAETHVRRLCEHVGVEYDPAMVAVTTSNTSFGGGQTSGIVATSRDRWRTELSPTEIWLGERIFGSVMRELGYEPAGREVRPSPGGLLRIAALLPGRLFNMLFRSPKPFRLSKVRRVLELLRGRS